MALSADDRLLGEKMDNYCSSSEDEEEEHAVQPSNSLPEPELDQYSGFSTNTGPKGVINDWRRFKQLENEKKQEQEKEKLDLMKKLSITCRTDAEDQQAKSAEEELEAELLELEDDFMKEYREKRLQEMKTMFQTQEPQFGKVLTVTKEEFLKEVDGERPSVTVCVHIYEEKTSACVAMNRCLACLAQEYPSVKFCKMTAADANVSRKFAVSAVPALLIYKKGELIGNFIRLSDEFGEEFFASDVESFLIEHGMLPDKMMSGRVLDQSSIRSNTTAADHTDTDSDYDVD